MRIVKKCEVKGNPDLNTFRTLSTIPTGTICRYGVDSYGPYLKVPGYMVDLSTPKLIPDNLFHNGSVSGYKELPNAYLVTGED